MKKSFTLTGLFVFLLLLPWPRQVLAESQLEGKAACGPVYTLLAPAAGTVKAVPAAPGMAYPAGTLSVEYAETVSRAPREGTVVFVPARKNDSAALLAELYGGAVMVKPAGAGKVTGEALKKYAGPKASGQTVFLKSNAGAGTGRGTLVLTGPDSFTVYVAAGEFAPGEAVAVFAAETRLRTEQIGTGYFTPEAEYGVGGEGYVSRLFAAAGDAVLPDAPLFAALPFPERDAPVFPGDCVAMEVYVKAGDRVEAGQPLVSYCLAEEIRITAEVFEFLLPCLEKDMAAAVTIPALDGVFGARLESIGALPLEGSQEAVYAAVFRLDENVPGLRVGLSAYIALPEDENTLEVDAAP